MAKKKVKRKIASAVKTKDRKAKPEIKTKDRKASMVLGILSIIFGLLFPFFGLIFGIIGLSVKKSRNKKRDVVLNVVGISISIVNWILAFFLFFPY